MYKIIQKRNIFFVISGIVWLVSLFSLLIWGLRLGIDFTGGSLLELEFVNDRPAIQTLEGRLASLELSNLSLQTAGEKNLIIRTVALSEETHQQILQKINQLFGSTASTTAVANPGEEKIKVPASALGIEGPGSENLDIEVSGEGVGRLIGQPITIGNGPVINPAEENFKELRFDSIGPTLGKELKTKAGYAIFFVLITIIAYISYAFRKASHPVESWKYGVSAIVALFHDVLIIPGVFAVLGHFFKIEVDALFVTALLTVLGYSVHDTIVTFDRIRENLHRHQEETFLEVINRSINETIVRSLNTSLTTFITLLTVFLFTTGSIKFFTLALMMGVIIGTYSSIFIASPLLLVWYKMKKI